MGIFNFPYLDCSHSLSSFNYCLLHLLVGGLQSFPVIWYIISDSIAILSHALDRALFMGLIHQKVSMGGNWETTCQNENRHKPWFVADTDGITGQILNFSLR